MSTGTSVLTLDDLLTPLPSSSKDLGALKKAAKQLTSVDSNVKKLDAPLPHRLKEKLDREAAYEQTKEEINKWQDTMFMIKDDV